MSSRATESTRMIEWLAWVELNKKKLVIGAAAVAIVIVALEVHQWHRNRAEAEASAALLKVEKAGVRPENAPEPDAQAFLRVAAAYPGTSAGARGALFAADALFRDNKYGEAKTQFESFLRNYGEHPFAPTAALGVAACWDAMNQTNEALRAYQDLLSRFAGSPVAPQAKLSLARLYEAKDEAAQALKVYDELVRLGARSA